MKLALRMTLVLTGIGLVSGGALALTYEATKLKIEENMRRARAEAARRLLPDAEGFEEHEIDRHTLYMVGKRGPETVGYVIVHTGPGFQGNITAAFAVDTGFGKILGIEILEQVETPGLGARIVEEGWRSQFKGLLLPLEVIKGKRQKPNQVEAITGATISSRSVCELVNEGVRKVKEAVK